MDRRDFLKTAGLTAASIAVEGCGRTNAAAGGISSEKPQQSSAENCSGLKPNILFCISDDQSWLHAGAYGSKMVKTPAFDRVAHEGVLFTNAFVSAPSCTPSRGAILTGQAFYRLREAAQLWGMIEASFDVYPDMLAKSGYFVGFTGKGWGPGDWELGGRKTNPAGGHAYSKIQNTPPAKGIDPCDYAANFTEFLRDCPSGKPFCFWYGCREPHRVYEKGSGLRLGKKLEDAEVPPFLPDVEDVKSDLLDYAIEIEWFDTHLGRMMKILEDRGELDNTIIVVTSDNGMPFPRAKATLYDYGVREPLAIRWPGKIKGGRVVDDFISFTDFAPTFLEIAGIEPACDMTGRSFLQVLLSQESGTVDTSRDHVVTGLERHNPLAFKKKEESAPCRAIRTAKYLYIRNYNPGVPAAGDAPLYKDVPPGPSKEFIVNHKDDDEYKKFFEMAAGPRPAEELYDLEKDPGQMNNVADQPQYAAIRKNLSEQLRRELVETKDPRAMGDFDHFNRHDFPTGPYAKEPLPVAARGSGKDGSCV
jgi:N-sulfoglucosamine sulfohydrolase